MGRDGGGRNDCLPLVFLTSRLVGLCGRSKAIGAILPYIEQPVLHDLGLNNNQTSRTQTAINGFAMAMCDGSVHTMNYSIDLETYRRLGDRAGGKPVDGKMF
jgi:hypothetical protein